MGRLLKPFILVAVLAGAALGLYWLAPRSGDALADARAAIDRRDFAAARKSLDRQIARNPSDLDARFLAARTARRDGDGEAAERHIALYLDAGGNPELGGLERGLRLVQAGDVAIAGGLYSFCTSHPERPEVPFILEALSRGFLEAGRPAGAVACLDKWLDGSLTPADRAQGLVWRGQALEQLDQNREAAEDYRRAIAIVPSHAEARLRLATMLSRSEPRTALDMLASLDKEAPGRPQVRVGIARCHRQLGDFDEASALLGPLLAERPDDVEIVTEAADLDLDRGRPRDAEPLLRRAMQLAPDNREPVALLGRCLKDLGRDADAAKMQEKLKQMNDEHERWLVEVKKQN